ncbi:MAG: hypothetical protein U9N14_01315 [Pseudomonadota bacterium]|nr:hypothetical protein [Pseudomonadota bacterium]
MNRPSLMLGMFLIGALAWTLFHTGHRVKGIEADLAAVEKNILQNRETILVLLAERAHLLRPERIDSIGRDYLHLAPLKAAQFVTLADVPYAKTAMELP